MPPENEEELGRLLMGLGQVLEQEIHDEISSQYDIKAKQLQNDVSSIDIDTRDDSLALKNMHLPALKTKLEVDAKQNFSPL